MLWIVTTIAAATTAAAKFDVAGADAVSGAVPSANISLDVDWAQFLSRHDLLWDWNWGASGECIIRPSESSLEYCGPRGSKGDCCVGVDASSSLPELQACDAKDPGQTFVQKPNGFVVSSATGLCLTSLNTSVVFEKCAADNVNQTWFDQDGFFTVGPTPDPTHSALSLGDGPGGDQPCLQVQTGTPLVTAGCHNGDRSQFFALQAKSEGVDSSGRVNLVPLTWVRTESTPAPM
jgi:hypothetical protein